MTQTLTSELFVVSLVVLLLVLMVLMVLCWVLKRSTSRNFTELKISTGRPARTLTIRTEPHNAHQLLDHLLDRIFLQVEPGPESGDTLGQEPEAEPGKELGGESSLHIGSDPEQQQQPAAASLPSRAVNALQDKLRKWITVTSPPPENPPPPDSSTSLDQTDHLGPERLDAAQHVSLSSQCSSCSDFWEEEQHEESQL